MSTPVIDSHCHAWRRWPYSPLVPDEDSRGTIEQLVYEMDANGVDQALVVCAAIENNPDNVEYVAFARERHPKRLLLVADLDCTWSATHHTPGAAERLRVLDDHYHLTGFAHYVADENDGWLTTGEADEVFALAAQRGHVISLGATPAWHADLREIARRHPTVPVICQTLGGVPAADGVESEAMAQVLASADVPSIHIKVAGFHYASARGWEYPWADAIALLERIHEAYGPERLCWGSDFPASTRFTTFRQSIEVVREHCPFFSDHDRALVFGGALDALLRERARR